MDLKEFGSRTRSIVLVIWTLVLGSLYFVAIPVALALLNEALGWSTWRLPGGRMVGACFIASGLGLVAYCNQLFHRIGRGSIVPIDPTRRLVVVGPFRYSRNPVFLGYLALLFGIFVGSGAPTLLVYVLAFVGYLRFFVGREESDLLERFGDEYRIYVQSVPRWLGLPSHVARRPTRRCS
jgi:protein-S-isoprenylcysteine O-methyltransferase Ste14